MLIPAPLRFTDSGSVGGTVEKAATDTKQKGEEVKRTPT